MTLIISGPMSPSRPPLKSQARPNHRLSQAENIVPKGESKTIFLRSLSTMVLAGVTVDRALDYLGDQVDDPKMSEVCKGMSWRIQGGYPLSQAMACFPKAFSKLQLRMVQMGEKTGTLDQVLLELSHYEEKERALVLKVKSALGYPGFILIIATLMMLLVPPYLMKGMFGLIEGSGVQPPLITVVVMKVTNFLRTPAFYLGLGALIGSAWFLGPRWYALPRSKMLVAQWISHIPTLGRLFQILAVARFSRALSVQIECGMNPLGALPISAEVTENPILIEAMQNAKNGLGQGDSFATSLTATGFFPKLMLNMVEAGEESAALGDMLGKAAEMYEAEVDHALDTFTALLEPMIMAGIGLMVGTLVLATMLPMAQVIENMR